MPSGRTGKWSYDPKITLSSVINPGKWSASRLGRLILGEQAPPYPVPEEILGSKATTDAVGDRKLSAPARNLTHFLGLGASTLLTAIPT